MHRERLIRLIGVLQAVPPERFDMSSFGHKTPCGTAACAVGWGCLDPGFNAEGLTSHWPGSKHMLVPVFDGSSGWFAVERFFELTGGQAEELFQEYMYPPDVKPQDVIARIKETLNGQ